MNPTLKSGMHPDAEILTAFAEQLLPAVEHDRILAHMATCNRCREVLFLAQQATSEDQVAPVAGSAVASAKKRASGFNGWRWMWIPATAFAGLIGVAVIMHFRHAASETQVTAELSPTDNLRKEESVRTTTANPPPASQSSEALKQVTRATPSEARDGAVLTDKDTAKELDEKKSIERRQVSVGAAAPPMVLQPGLPGNSIHGMMAARAKSAPVGGPMAANQFQQQSVAEQQNALQSQSAQFDATNSPVIAGSVPAAASQTVTVQPKAEVSAPAPAQPAPLDLIPMTGQSYSLSSVSSSAVSKAQRISLPTGLGTLSVARSGGRTIALDTAGALFLSEDAGKHWQPVHMQWTGHAVLVRTRPTGTQTDTLQAPQTGRFELINDNLQTWVSSDGKIWTLEPLPVK